MQEGGDMRIICIFIAHSLCYKAETNPPLQSNYTPIKMLKIYIYKIFVLSVFQSGGKTKVQCRLAERMDDFLVS